MKKAFLAIFIMVIVAMFFTACNPNPKPKIEEPKPSEDSWQILTNADETLVYTELVKAVKNSLNDISTDKVKQNNPIFSIDSKLKIQFNDHLFWVTFKMNYNQQDLNDIRVAIEVMDEEEETIILGAYFINNFIYLKIMDGEAGEMKFPLQNSVIGGMFPIEFQDIQVSTMAQALNALLKINDNITGKYRMYGTIPEYQFAFSIDLPNTLTRLVNTLNQSDLLKDLDTETLSKIIERIMGVTFDDIVTGNLPESSIIVDFSTWGSKLSTFKIDLNVEQGGASQNTIFGGDVINFSLDLTKLVIDNKNTSIPFFGSNEYLTYPNYLDQSFGVLLNVIEKGETSQDDTNYKLKGEFKLDLDEIINNQLLFEVLDDTDSPVAGIYIYRNMLYLYGVVDEVYQMRTSFEVDIIDIYDKISSEVDFDELVPEENRKTSMEYIAYFLGAFRIHGDKLSFVINSDFYEVILPNFADMIVYIDEALDDIDLQEELELAGIDIVGYLMENVYEIYLDIDEEAESFIYVVDGSIVFPEGVEGVQDTDPIVE